MNKGLVLSMAAVGLLCVACTDARTADPSSVMIAVPLTMEQRMATLVAQLGDEHYTRREQASRELAEMGLPALPALRQAAEHHDPEVAVRAKALVETIRTAAAAECLLWKIQLPDLQPSNIVLSENLVFFHGVHNSSTGLDGCKAHAVSQADGTTVWETVTAVWRPRLDLRGGKLICHSSSNTGPMALDPATGEVLWKVLGESPSWVGENTIVCTGHSNWLSGLSAKTGGGVWIADAKRLTNMGHNLVAYPVSIRLAKDVCLVVIMHCRVYEATNSWTWVLAAVAADTGKKLWDVTLDGPYLAGAFDDERFYVVLKNNPRVRVFDIKSGLEQESRLTLDATLADERYHLNLKVADGTLLCGTPIGLTAYDIASGEQRWRYTPRGSGPAFRQETRIGFSAGHDDLPVTVHDGEVLLSADNALLSLDLETGTPLWEYPMESAFAREPVVRDGIVYFLDGNVYYRTHTNGLPMRTVNGQAVEDIITPPKSNNRYLYALDLTKARQLGPAIRNANGE